MTEKSGPTAGEKKRTRAEEQKSIPNGRGEHVQKNVKSIANCRQELCTDKVTTELENVAAESASAQQVVAGKVVVEKAAEEKVAIAKSAVANVAVEEVAAKTNSSAKTITAKQLDLGDSSKSLRAEEAHTNTATVQQDVPRERETVVEQVIKKRAIVDKATVAAQDARVKKMMKL